MPFNDDPVTDLIGSAMGSTGAGVVAQIAPVVAQAATQITDSIMQGIYGYKGPEFNPAVALHAMDAAMNYTTSTNNTILGLAALAARKMLFATDAYNELNREIIKARAGIADLKSNYGPKAKIRKMRIARLRSTEEKADDPTKEELVEFQHAGCALAAAHHTNGILCGLYNKKTQEFVSKHNSVVAAYDAIALDANISFSFGSLLKKIVSGVETVTTITKKVLPYVEKFTPIIKSFIN
jgi:IMP cyclohydrolase